MAATLGAACVALFSSLYVLASVSSISTLFIFALVAVALLVRRYYVVGRPCPSTPPWQSPSAPPASRSSPAWTCSPPCPLSAVQHALHLRTRCRRHARPPLLLLVAFLALVVASSIGMSAYYNSSYVGRWPWYVVFGIGWAAGTAGLAFAAKQQLAQIGRAHV